MADFICRFVDGVEGDTVLDLNDETTYLLTDNSRFPLPKIAYNWMEASSSQARQLVDWNFSERNITLSLVVKGDSPADADSNLRTLFKQLIHEGVLEVKIWDAANSLFYKTYPALPDDLPEFMGKYVRDAGLHTHVKVDIPVDTEVIGPWEEFQATKSLGPDDAFRLWTLNGDWTPDHWDEYVTGTGTIERYSADKLIGNYSCKLTTTVAGDISGIIDKNPIAVDELKDHNPKIYVKLISGTDVHFYGEILCYDDGDVLLDTVNLLPGAIVDNIHIVNTWRDPIETIARDIYEYYLGVLHKSTAVSGPVMPEGTTKVKRRFYCTSPEGGFEAIFDAAYLGCSEYVHDSIVTNPISIDISQDAGIKGDALTEAIVIAESPYRAQVETFQNLIWAGSRSSPISRNANTGWGNTNRRLVLNPLHGDNYEIGNIYQVYEWSHDATYHSQAYGGWINIRNGSGRYLPVLRMKLSLGSPQYADVQVWCGVYGSYSYSVSGTARISGTDWIVSGLMLDENNYFEPFHAFPIPPAGLHADEKDSKTLQVLIIVKVWASTIMDVYFGHLALIPISGYTHGFRDDEADRTAIGNGIYNYIPPDEMHPDTAIYHTWPPECVVGLENKMMIDPGQSNQFVVYASLDTGGPGNPVHLPDIKIKYKPKYLLVP